jgi:hypothetical protein
MTLAHANPTPLPAAPSTLQRWKIELKVIAATAATFAVSVVLAVLNLVENNHALLGSTPAVLQFVIVAVLPTAITFLSGYMAKHTPRLPDGS